MREGLFFVIAFIFTILTVISIFAIPILAIPVVRSIGHGLNLWIQEGRRKKKCDEPGRSGIDEIDRMTGREFENQIQVLLNDMGYQGVKLTSETKDFGADLIVDKSGTRIAVQAKRWNSRVGVKAIQEVSAATQFYDCDRGLVITNNFFTRPAQQLAQRCPNIELWDRERLVKELTHSI